MELTDLGRTGIRVAPICLGAMNFGMPNWGCDEEAAAQIVRTYRDAGGNFFDTANVYGGGESERILGRLVAGSRDEVVLASKVGFPSPDGGAWGLGPDNIHARRSRERSAGWGRTTSTSSRCTRSTRRCPSRTRWVRSTSWSTKG